MIDTQGLARMLMGTWDRTKQPLKERGAVLPIGEYEDGSVGPAWPGLLAAPAEAMVNFGRLGYDSPEALADNARSAFDIAGAAMTGGFATGLAGGVVDNALGSAGGRLAKGTADLPMDLASRMQRAKDMGFDTDRVLYHGTKSDFDEFQPSTHGNIGPGVYATNVPEFAGQFAAGDGGRTMPIVARGDFMPYREWMELAYGPRPSGESVSQTTARVMEEAQRRGFSGVEYGSNNTVSIFDPRNIRSTAAAFDPAKSDSANLLAANAKPGAAVPLAVQSAERQGAKAATQEWLPPFHDSSSPWAMEDLQRLDDLAAKTGLDRRTAWAIKEHLGGSFQNFRQLLSSSESPYSLEDAGGGRWLIRSPSGSTSFGNKAQAEEWLATLEGNANLQRDALEFAKNEFLDKAKERNPEKVRTPSYRYAYHPSYNELKPGDEFIDPAFMSTTKAAPGDVNQLTPERANALLRIKQWSGLDIEDSPFIDAIPMNRGEQEVLLPPGRKFNVIDAKRNPHGMTIIDLEELFANAPTGAALPLGLEAQQETADLDPALMEVLRMYGLMP